MTGTTRVSPSEVIQLSELIGSKSAAISATLDTLDSKVRQLEANWDGDSKEAYAHAQRQWKQQIAQMNELLTRVSGKLVEISTEYGETDRRNAGRFTR
jgi:WXG100 family type VII secretion target